MTAPLDLRSFGRDLADLNSRVSQLRASRLSFGNSEGALDAALLELETAEEELRTCHDELENTSQQLTQRSERHERERQLLRQVFRHAPFGLFVLDHDGAIRQANPRAAAMTGAPLEFLAGKPLPVFIDMAARATFRSHLATVLRTGQDSLITCPLTSRGRAAGGLPAQTQLALTRLTGPGSLRPHALVAASAGEIPPEATPPAYPKTSQVAALVDGSLRLDVMSQMTRLLLGDTADQRLPQAAVELLTGEYADWAIIDLIRGGKPVRQAIAGSRGPLSTANPDSRVIRDVMTTGGPVVLDPIEDEDAFGHTPSGAPILAAARAGSLISVGLPDAGQVAGALTVIRRAGRRGFALADATLFTEVGTHIAMALARRGLLDDRLAQ